MSAHVTAKNAVESPGLGNTMRPDSWLWGALKPENLTESAEEEWMTEKSGASAYAYKVADVHMKLAEHCIKEWNKALEKVEENREEDQCQWEEEDQLAQEEEKRIWEEEEAMQLEAEAACNYKGNTINITLLDTHKQRQLLSASESLSSHSSSLELAQLMMDGRLAIKDEANQNEHMDDVG
ncbi:hypothetical protein ARMGADRAFT_1033058 [Armillaria gallica]|uniref:Uncharacterized protein n=1 Tax=Armillaria gallica TaxID=47427 RepID=A0A2H3D2J9_ARMGA|nr:hypothetical protein ARMGADRAFT_1033058 [Armillaria gallica]